MENIMRDHIFVVLLTLALASPAVAGEPTPDEPIQLVPQATCSDSAEGTPIPIRPRCTFDGWAAPVGEGTIAATHATGRKWLPRCVVDDQGACPFALTVTGTAQDGTFEVASWSVAPVGDVAETGQLLAPADVMCTEEECPPDDRCCNGCGHGGWKLANRRPDVRALVAAGVAELPRCELSGCGGCSYQLAARGVEVGGLFIVSAHEQTEATALRPMGRCTMMACGSANPCCNSCAFMGWSAPGSTGTIGATAAKQADPLPDCELDGCGRCPWLLLVGGEEEAGTFVVRSWERIP